MKSALALIPICTISLLLGAIPVLALDPALDVSQYAHSWWTVRDGFSQGNVYAMAQTPDGYLWLGSEFGLFRFDGIHAVPWQPPAGQQLPDKNINALLVTRDGTLWIGTFAGLATWSDGKFTLRPELGRDFVTSLFEESDGTVWAGSLEHETSHAGRLCAIRSGGTQCYGEDGAFGRAVWALYEDSSGNLWSAAQSGLWRLKPGPPKRYPTPTELIGLNKTADGPLLVAMHGSGLLQLTGDKLESYPIRSATNSKTLLRARELDSNRLLRDRDGGLWIGTIERGLIHIHNGRTDVFTNSDGLTGDVILSMLEDHEGNVWVASTGGLDRFGELPVATLSTKQGLSSDASHAVLAAKDGSIWVGSNTGLTRWKNGKTTIFSKANGLPEDATQSLFQDDDGRVWVSTARGLAYFKDGRFLPTDAVPGGEVHFITGDKAGNVWLSESKRLVHLVHGRLLDQFPWSELGDGADALLAEVKQGGVWLAFWNSGGVSYYKDGRIRASYTAKDGLGEGHVPDLHRDTDGAIWAATEGGGLSRLKDGRIATLTTKNGLPCNAIHWSIEDDDHALWLNTVCGLVRITRSELDAWIADANRRIETTVWNASDGFRLSSNAPSTYSPRVAKSTDGRLWFVAGIVQVVDPHHLAINKLAPPVHIEQIIANHKTYWQNLTGSTVSHLRLPPRIRDLTIDYTASSLVAPEKVHFKYKLEGQDSEWREVVNDREVQYSNLRPGPYRFRVIASNNSGVWNEQGDSLEFSVAPAYYQTNWFRVLCAAAFLALLLAAYQLRVRQLHHEFDMTLDARVGERTRIARDLHDTLLQSAHGVLLRFQTVSQLLPDRPVEAKEKLDNAIDQTAEFITEARDEVQGLRDSTVQSNDLALAISTLGQELGTDSANHRPAFRLAVEGEARNLHPILRDEIYKIAAEALRNAFRHSQAQQIEVEIRYDNEQFRLRVRDDGKGVDPAILSSQSSKGHYGLPGMRERATLVGGKLVVWSKVGAGTEVELRIPASSAYATAQSRSWFSRKAKA